VSTSVPLVEVERRELEAVAAELAVPRPCQQQAAGDHQVQHEEQVVGEPEHEPFAEPFDAAQALAVQRRRRWADRAQQERAAQPHTFAARGHRAALRGARGRR
jgi:hypothetical protein